MPSILLVDDDIQGLASTRKILELQGYTVQTAVDGREALDQIQSQHQDIGLVITDVRMPRMGGLEFLKAMSVIRKTVPVVLMTAHGRVEEAVWAMKFGAVDFLTKPFKRQALLSAVERCLRLTGSVSEMDASGNTHGRAYPMVGRSHAMQELRDLLRRVAPTEASVLITGESGSGKELVARHVHHLSPRSRGPFIALNCGAIAESLLESELFGHEKGAFSGAIASKAGLFEAANGGVLFLDEIGDMPLSAQTKLLRVLQEREVRRVGATESRPVDVRVVAATHHDLRKRVSEGLFREDLLFRLDVVTIRVPALNERKEDIEVLAAHFLALFRERHAKPVLDLSPEALACLKSHPWPGNIRELSNVLERAVVFCDSDRITPANLPQSLRASTPARTIEIPIGASLDEVEELLIQKTLEATHGDKEMTARLLGVNSRTIYRRLEKKEAPADQAPTVSPEPTS